MFFTGLDWESLAQKKVLRFAFCTLSFLIVLVTTAPLSVGLLTSRLSQIAPPFVPDVGHPEAAACFDEEFTTEPVRHGMLR